MIQLNKIYQIDVLEGLRQLPDNSIDVIITSPPYNKIGLNGKQHEVKWKHCNIKYSCDVDSDNMPEDAYQQWQLEILNECYRVLKNDGSMFYNHKNRIWANHGEIIAPYQWLLKSPFKIRQEITWDRKSSCNVCTVRYLPTTEKIFWLTKSNNPNFVRNSNIDFNGEVWQIPFKNNTAHPAPFPIELPDNILQCFPEGITVLDPFMGSGTTAISALKHNDNYIGFELFQEYVDMSNERIKNYGTEQ